MNTAYTESYKVSRTFDAPIDFVYAWCTDFREDDPKMMGSKNKRIIHERTKERVIWTVTGNKLATGADPVRVVWLRPPSAWHLDTCGDVREVGDYRLTRLGRNRTRLDMEFTVTYYDRKEIEDKEKWETETLGEWDNYGKYLERDYRKTLRV